MYRHGKFFSIEASKLNAAPLVRKVFRMRTPRSRLKLFFFNDPNIDTSKLLAEGIVAETGTEDVAAALFLRSDQALSLKRGERQSHTGNRIKKRASGKFRNWKILRRTNS